MRGGGERRARDPSKRKGGGLARPASAVRASRSCSLFSPLAYRPVFHEEGPFFGIWLHLQAAFHLMKEVIVGEIKTVFPV